MQYEPRTISDYYRQRSRLVWGRRIALVGALITFSIRLAWDFVTGSLTQNQPQRAWEFREKLTELGPTFIKLGQILSCRPDIVPPIYLEELTKLQDQLPPFPNHIAYQLIEEELGDNYNNIYGSLIEKPVAAASLGQVYKGTLKTGEIVAVKVQRPGLVECISLDIYILRKIAAWAQESISFVHSDLVALIDELAISLFEEMDYTQEGRNAERFAELYGDINNIAVPRIYWQYSGRRVLTMEWITGTKLTELETIKAQGLDPNTLIDVGFQCCLRQLLEEGYFHADPHPGNLLATPDGKLAYLDFGMMSSVEPSYRYRLLESVVHIVIGDFEGLAQDYKKLDFLPPETDVTSLIPELTDIFGGVMEATVSTFGFNRIIRKLSPLLYKYPFKLPTYYLLIFRSAATLEGIAIKLNPNFQPFNETYPYVAQRLLTDSSPQLRTCLQEIVYQDGGIQWHVLEDLLGQVRTSRQFDISALLHQGLEFLYSEQGSILRNALVEEMVTSLENLSYKTLGQITASVGLAVNVTGKLESPNLERMEKIGAMIIESSRFDLESVPKMLELLLKQETQRLGQQIASEIARRMFRL
ncbi:AarF/ABC1/UbiB kinase family protein [Moorena sp. SIO3B2]|uniref:ABC1 kinase family protein n=1 Tax=Moorena sp. SIO3B2 TaxID=2607827 RepID=UPI0013CC8B0F|nr:AarF/ABC1/UbiB kinase family protein [Moorena sp. SIO3B2]NEP36347.1 AarF/ABC1/UbiB kinase family protein [Moorena sp. SIO3B2]